MRVGSLVYGIAARPRLFVMVAFAAMACAWGLSTVPFSGADEPSHYLRALAVSRGEIVMARPRRPLHDAYLEQPVGILLPSSGYRTEAMNTRVLAVVTNLAPPQLFDRCVERSHNAAGTCLEGTYTGTYTPVAYILPAVGVTFATNATVALWLGRLGAALGCLGFLFLALTLASRGGRWSILGLVLAVSPTVLFMSSVLNADGLEIAASIAFACGCLRIGAEQEAAPIWVIATTAASCVVVILTWALGPLYAAFGLLILLGLVGRSGVISLVSARRRVISLCCGAVVTAIGAYAAWDLAMGRTHGGLELSPLLPSVGQASHQLSLVWDQSVGVVGWINIYLPSSLYQEYLLTAVMILALALGYGNRNDRVILVAVTILAVLTPVLLNQWLLRPPSDQGVQGRYVIPVVAWVPLVGGHLLSRNAARLGQFVTRWGPAVSVCLIAFVQVGALIYTARFVTGGALPSFAIRHAQWAPPLGWGVWLLLTSLGGGSLALWGMSLVVPDRLPARRRARSGGPQNA